MVFSKYQFFFVLSSIIIVLPLSPPPSPKSRLLNHSLKITVIFLWISIIYRIIWLIEQFCSRVFQRFYSRISTNRIQYTYSLIGIKLLYHQHFHHHGYYRNFYHCNQVLLHLSWMPPRLVFFHDKTQLAISSIRFDNIIF